jgi:hypothetical protein
VGCLLGFSSFFVSGSPVARSYTIVEGPIHWRGVLEEGGGLVYLFGDTFEVCFHLRSPLKLAAAQTNI